MVALGTNSNPLKHVSLMSTKYDSEVKVKWSCKKVCFVLPHFPRCRKVVFAMCLSMYGRGSKF